MNLVKIVIKLLLLTCCVPPPINTQYLTFWSERNGRGKSKNASGVFLLKHCRSAPESDFGKVSITKVKNTCIQFFPNKNCTGNIHNKIFGDMSDLPSWPSLAFQACVPHNTEGLNVVIYNRSNWDQEPFRSYRNLCKCVNIPDDLHKNNIVMDPEGKLIVLYVKENCAGQSNEYYGENVRDKSFQAFDRPRNCLILSGILTNITFERMRTKNITLKPIEVISHNIYLSTAQNVSVNFVGEDRKTLSFSNIRWTTGLVPCELKEGLAPNHMLWESRWENDTRILNELLEFHCKKPNRSNFNPGTYKLKLEQAFLSTWNISIAADTNTTISAQRGYVTKSIEYKILFNVTGISESNSNRASADDLENSFPRSGLTFVKKLDATTVLAEEEETVEVEYPISTLYKTEVQPSNQYSD